jgi:hypothetical protein
MVIEFRYPEHHGDVRVFAFVLLSTDHNPAANSSRKQKKKSAADVPIRKTAAAAWRFMSRSTRNANRRKLTKSAGSVFQQSWFVQMLPSPVNGEVRMRMKRPSAWVSVAAATELMACSIQTVHNLCEEGTLEWRWLDHRGSGGKKLVLVDSIQRYITRKS